MLNYKWDKTARLTALLGEIEVLKRVYDALPQMSVVEEKLLRRSLLKSAVYSARIEGIPATEQSPKLEAQNLLSAYRRIFSGGYGDKFSTKLVRDLHSAAMKNLSPGAGEYRNEPWAIYNQAGVAVHVAPPHFRLQEMMDEYSRYISGLYDSTAEKSAAAQFILEKIHPFADGNGRVGRLVSAYLLQTEGYGFKGLLMLEEYIEKHREEYYEVLTPSDDMTGFVEYFLEGVVRQANAGLERLKDEPEDEGAPHLLPRREEILAVIGEQPRSSFDFIHRRFLSVNPKTLHYDLGWLQKNKLVRKLGVSRGAVYEKAD